MNARRLAKESPRAAINMEARSKLMVAIRHQVETWKITQAEAAERLGITQPRTNDLLRDRVDKFSLDALLKLASRADLTVRFEALPLTVGPTELGALGVDPEQPRTPARDSARGKRTRK